MLLPLTNITFDTLHGKIYTDKNITVTVARLDKIHSDVSGNKLFKLHYFVKACLQTSHKTLLTFGGAFSNHLVATAYLCNANNLISIGIIRGEKPVQLSHTLIRCMKLGMQLKFVSRVNYKENGSELLSNLSTQFGDFIMVPEGGYSNEGAKGASLIMDVVNRDFYTHICTCVGTGTTLAGLLLKKKSHQQIIAIPVIKNMTDIFERLNFLEIEENNKPIIFDEYHFGGYAKYTEELITFMNCFYEEEKIPTDFVYTAKMMYAVTDKLKNNYFQSGSNILCLHTGGLQGNKSLKEHRLIF